MNLLNIPLPEKVSLRFALTRWGFDLNNQIHIAEMPIKDYCNK